MITQTEDRDLIKKIMCNKLLFKVSMPDEDIAALEAGIWEPSDSAVYLNYDGKAIIRLYQLTNISVDMHIHLLPEYWGSGISDEMAREIEDWLIQNTNYCKIVVQTPQCCREVLQAAVRDGYQLEGVLTGAIFWRGKVENMVILAKFLNRNTNKEFN